MQKLPSLILFEEYNNDWDLYIEVVYQIFCDDIKEFNLMYQGRKVVLKRHPIYLGKEKSFWHLTSEGKIEDQRVPSLRRCERIPWIKYIIENGDKDFIKVWRNFRYNRENICLATDLFEYVVILSKRDGYYLLLSAYPVERERKRERFKDEYEAYKKRNPPK